MTEQEQNLINAIFGIRIRNNTPWKKIIEIAMNHAPEETKRALRDIGDNDQAVTDLNRILSHDHTS